MEEIKGLTLTQQKELMKYISDNMKIPVLGAGGGFAPLGTINAYMGTVAPQGWLVCNGQTVNITDYPELATHFASQLGSSNFFGGDGTTTFAMPDLRGEFLRGSGTNSHENQGSGSNVGVHQDGTEVPVIGTKGTSSANLTITGRIILNDTTFTGTWYKNDDSRVQTVSGSVKNIRASATASDTGGTENVITTRPTNTSVTYIIKAAVSGTTNHQYSTEEQIVDTWIDGSLVYERVFTFDSEFALPSNTWTATTFSKSGISNIINCIAYKNNDSVFPFIAANINFDNTYIALLSPRSSNTTITGFILQYTKTQS